MQILQALQEEVDAVHADLLWLREPWIQAEDRAKRVRFDCFQQSRVVMKSEALKYPQFPISLHLYTMLRVQSHLAHWASILQTLTKACVLPAFHDMSIAATGHLPLQQVRIVHFNSWLLV